MFHFNSCFTDLIAVGHSGDRKGPSGSVRDLTFSQRRRRRCKSSVSLSKQFQSFRRAIMSSSSGFSSSRFLWIVHCLASTLYLHRAAERDSVGVLTPWCRVLLVKLTGLQTVKELPAFYGTRRFITALTSVRHLSVSWASPIQSIYPKPTSQRSFLILSTHLRLGLSIGLRIVLDTKT